MDVADLRRLDAAVGHLLAEVSFAATLASLREELARSTETFVWTTLHLSAIPVELPDAIESGWVFHLRKDVPSGAHYHPNSVQHMVIVAGQGVSEIGGERRPAVPFTSSAPVEDRWLVIGQGVAHEFTPVAGDMTVISFHTCTAEELEEVDCESGGVRHYEGADA